MTEQYAFWILVYLVISYFIGYYLIKNELEFKLENKENANQFHLNRHHKFVGVMFIISPLWVPTSFFNLLSDWIFEKFKDLVLVIGKWADKKKKVD